MRHLTERDFCEILDRMPQAIFLLGSAGAVLHCNSAGEALLARGDLVSATNRVLKFAVSNAPDVRNLVSRATAAGGPTGILLDAGARLPSVATLLSMVSAPPRILLLIQDLLPCDSGLPGRLSTLFGLTAAEAQVGVLLGNGLTAEEIAQRRTVAVSTVRAQMKSLSLKLGCRRQAKVAAIIRSIIPIAGPQEV